MARMKILITNDDGIQNKGLRLLVEWAKKIGDVTVIAPKVEQSAKSHGIEIHKSFEIKKVDYMDGVEAYSVDSTPADCVRYGFLGLKNKYDMVLSGINKGYNVGADVVYSGTVAAVFEATRFKARGIAFSADFESQEIASKYLDDAYNYLLENKLFDETPIFNINLPDELKGFRITCQGSPFFSDAFILTGENMYMQDGDPIPDEFPNDLNRDTVAVKNGYISITPLVTSRTDMRIFEKYKTKD